MPTTPTAPRPVLIGRNSRFAPGSVSEPRPAERFFSQHHFAAARSASSSMSSGGKPARTVDRAVLRQQDDDAHLQHQRDLMHRRPQQIVEIRRARQLAAELIQLLGGARPLSRDDRLRAHARGQVAGDHRGDGEEEQRDDVLRVGDGEGVERRQEEEVVGQHADESRRTAPATGRTPPRTPAPRSGTPSRRWRRPASGAAGARRRARPRRRRGCRDRPCASPRRAPRTRRGFDASLLRRRAHARRRRPPCGSAAAPASRGTAPATTPAAAAR